jgi:hypothetical protein
LDSRPVLYGGVRRIDSPLRTVVLCFALLSVVAAGVVAADPGSTNESGDVGGWGGSPFGEPDDDGDRSPLSFLDDPITLVAFVVLGSVAVVVAERKGLRESDDGADPPDFTALERAGMAAGRASRRLRAAETDAESLRADWAELASALGVDDPQGCSPETVRECAREAGVDNDHAVALVDTFEIVRSGGGHDRHEREAAGALAEFYAAYAPDREDGDD